MSKPVRVEVVGEDGSRQVLDLSGVPEYRQVWAVNDLALLGRNVERPWTTVPAPPKVADAAAEMLLEVARLVAEPCDCHSGITCSLCCVRERLAKRFPEVDWPPSRGGLR